MNRPIGFLLLMLMLLMLPGPCIAQIPVLIAQETWNVKDSPTMPFFSRDSYQLILAFTAVDTADFNVTVSFYDIAPEGPEAETLNAHWTIEVDNPNAVYEATAFFYYSDDMLSRNYDENLLEGAAQGRGARWRFYGGLVNPINNFVVVTGITDFSEDWTLGPQTAFNATVPTLGFWGTALLLGLLSIQLTRRRTRKVRAD